MRALVVLILLTAAVFAQLAGFSFLHWDDPSHLVDNPLVVAPLGEGWGALFATESFGYPAPLTVLGWWAERGVHGMSPAGFHLVNLLVHLVSIALLHRLLVRLAQTERAAAIAAGLFALHPIVVEPVAWVTGRKDLQATALLLGSLLVLLGRRGQAITPARIAAASGLALLAILSKPTTAVAPLLMALVLWHDEGAVPLRRALALAPLTLLAVALVIVGNRGHQQLTGMATRTTSEAVRQVIAAWAMQSGHLLVPRGLLPVYYDLPDDPGTLTIGLGLGLLALVVFVAWRERKTWIGGGLAFFLVAYAPVAAILPNRRWVADSYLYLPLVGVAIAVGVAIDRRWPKRVPAITLALPALLFALLSFTHARTYATNTNLWEGVIDRYPTRPAALALYGMGLSADGREDEAAKVFVHIAKEYPDHPGIESNQAWAFLRLGLADRAKERLERGAARGDRECIRALQRLQR